MKAPFPECKSCGGWDKDATISRLTEEVERLRKLADVARLDVMWQELVAERDIAKADLAAARKVIAGVREIVYNPRHDFDGCERIMELKALLDKK